MGNQFVPGGPVFDRIKLERAEDLLAGGHYLASREFSISESVGELVHRGPVKGDDIRRSFGPDSPLSWEAVR